jgi:DnaJ-class molecular chaperone
MTDVDFDVTRECTTCIGRGTVASDPCDDCEGTGTVPSSPKQPCGWCCGEGALRDEEGKLGEDCPRCDGTTRLTRTEEPR